MVSPAHKAALVVLYFLERRHVDVRRVPATVDRPASPRPGVIDTRNGFLGKGRWRIMAGI